MSSRYHEYLVSLSHCKIAWCIAVFLLRRFQSSHIALSLDFFACTIPIQVMASLSWHHFMETHHLMASYLLILTSQSFVLQTQLILSSRILEHFNLVPENCKKLTCVVSFHPIDLNWSLYKKHWKNYFQQVKYSTRFIHNGWIKA